MLLISTSAAVSFLRASVPDWAWLLGSIESANGQFRFPAQLTEYIAKLKIQAYPRLYENETAIGLIVLRGFLSTEEIQALNTELEAASPSERGEVLLELLADLESLDHGFVIPKTPEEKRRTLEAFEALSADEQASAVRTWQHLFCGLLAGFYQALAVTVHGAKMTTLVAQAKTGDDEALAKAIQIDKHTLTEIPYFKDRWSRAQTEGDAVLLRAIGGRLARPPYLGKIRHKELYLAFSFLDSVGLLSAMRHQELLDLIDQAGIGLHKNRIEDPKNFSKRLLEYRRFQRVGIDLSTP